MTAVAVCVKYVLYYSILKTICFKNRLYNSNVFYSKISIQIYRVKTSNFLKIKIVKKKKIHKKK